MNYIVILLVLVSSSCYRMPEEGEVSTLPNTNNPSLTRHKETVPMPGIQY
ncbi:MAG: hypothetical protein JSR37_07330 [Verrucomicrobia bacterium]|nr:hypothetical protein [Verrucomicrobiota bacterium]MBS0637421.1 hypothetical protein [Verrucomicrobiota bacterium]